MIFTIFKILSGALVLAIASLAVFSGGCAGVAPIRSVNAKPGSSTVVSSRASVPATVGRVFPVVVDFAQVGPAGASVSFTTDPELALMAASLPRSLPPGSSTLSVDLQASVNGLSFLNVFIQEAGGGRAVSIPVQVGAGGPRMESSAGLKPGIGGQLAHFMQVR